MSPYVFPIIETPAQKRQKDLNMQKTEICTRFLANHPKLTDEQEIMVFRARFYEPTIEGFKRKLKSIESNALKAIQAK